MYTQNHLHDEPIFLTSEVSNRIANQLTQQNTQFYKPFATFLSPF